MGDSNTQFLVSCTNTDEEETDNNQFTIAEKNSLSTSSVLNYTCQELECFELTMCV